MTTGKGSLIPDLIRWIGGTGPETLEADDKQGNQINCQGCNDKDPHRQIDAVCIHLHILP